MLSATTGPVKRKQRYPKYSEDEILRVFAPEVSKGYCFKQSAERCKFVFEWVENTLYSDDELLDHMINLSMAAGARIRAGDLPVPDRHDGLFGPVPG